MPVQCFSVFSVFISIFFSSLRLDTVYRSSLTAFSPPLLIYTIFLPCHPFFFHDSLCLCIISIRLSSCLAYSLNLHNLKVKAEALDFTSCHFSPPFPPFSSLSLTGAALKCIPSVLPTMFPSFPPYRHVLSFFLTLFHPTCCYRIVRSFTSFSSLTIAYCACFTMSFALLLFRLPFPLPLPSLVLSHFRNPILSFLH